MEEKPVRVVLLGWHDATERHLRSIANFHAAHGRAVLPFLSDASGSLSRKQGFLEHGEKLARALAEAHHAQPLPIVFHSFSNAGLWSLAGLLDVLAAKHPAILEAHIATISPLRAKVMVGHRPPGKGETLRLFTCRWWPSGPPVTCTSEL